MTCYNPLRCELEHQLIMMILIKTAVPPLSFLSWQKPLVQFTQLQKSKQNTVAVQGASWYEENTSQGVDECIHLPFIRKMHF